VRKLVVVLPDLVVAVGEVVAIIEQVRAVGRLEGVVAEGMDGVAGADGVVGIVVGDFLAAGNSGCSAAKVVHRGGIVPEGLDRSIAVEHALSRQGQVNRYLIFTE
jgi:hypothetical protein